MGFFSNIYNKVSNLFGTVKKTAENWLKGRYLVPGYNYCGPKNPLDNGEPVNMSDASCRNHDYEYDLINKNKHQFTDADLKRQIRESDDRLLENLNKFKSDGIGNRIAYLGISAKKKLEDWGLLDPKKFTIE